MMLTGLSIICIGILLNMTGQKAQVTGLTPAFIVMLYKASVQRIGEIMKVMISRGLNDTTDAPSYGRHILPSFDQPPLSSVTPVFDIRHNGVRVTEV